MKMLKPISERLLETKNNAMLFKDGAEPLECTINFQDLKDAIALIELLKTSAKEKDQLIENMAEVIEDMAGIIEDQQERIDIMAADMPEWISVDERLPQNDEDVLVWVNGTHRDMAYRDEGVWYDEEHNHLKNITHWMPLPKPPKEGEQQ